jgi:hypothetical protein
MACSDYSVYREFWYNGQFLDAAYCPFADLMGPLLVGLLFFGAIGLSLYIASGSATVPLTLAIILAAVVFVEVPAGAVQIGAIAVILVLGVAGYLMVQRLEGI